MNTVVQHRVAGTKRLKTVAVVQISMGDYRDTFVAHLMERSEGRYDIRLHVGKRYFGGTTRTSAYILAHPARRPAINWLYRDRAGFQLLDYLDVLRADVAILELNPRLLHTWMLIALRRLLGRRTVLWGHAWARVGASGGTGGLRSRLRRSADALLLYTRSQKQELLAHRSEEFPAESLHVATNALYRRSEIVAAEPKGDDFVYVGRLVADKKPLVLARAFAAAAGRLPDTVCLHLVGEGPERAAIQACVAQAGLGERIRLHGHVGDPEQLRDLYAASLFSVSPGYVGLSATQSLSFGRPVLVSRDEPHAPEIEALEEGFNAVFFDTDDVARLADTMVRLHAQRADWRTRFEPMAVHCRKRYSVEAMVAGVEAAIDG